ncbi:MAG: sigma-70 family RNA polymerase sigma factor [Planctomycetaceae bacterium]
MGRRSTQELMNSCQGLVRSIAWKIHQKVPRNVELDDLIGYGQIGLAEAARDFDQDRETQFTTYAYHRVRGAILDGLSTMSWFKHADYHRGRYEYAANEVLTAEAENSEAGETEIEWFTRTTRSLCGAYVMSLVSDASSDPAADGGMDGVQPSAGIDRSETQAVVRSLLADLPDQEQSLMRRVYFDGWSIKQAGEEIGISKAWASRLHARGLERLALRLGRVD